MMATEEKQRCQWCRKDNPAYVAYHDHEWGLPLRRCPMLYPKTFGKEG